MLGPLTYLDAVLLGMIALSGLLSMYCGLARELFRISSWVAAAAAVALVVRLGTPLADQLAKQYLSDWDPAKARTIALVALGGVVFLIVLTVVNLITIRLSDAVLDSHVGMIDRLLGLVFGAVRGFIIVLIPFMFYQQFFPAKEQHPDWVRKSLSINLLESTSRTVLPMFSGVENLLDKVRKPDAPQR